MEFIPILAFLGVFASVYVLAGGFLVRALYAKLRGRKPAVSRSRVWIRRVVFALAGFGIMCMGYGYFIEPYWLDVTHVRIESHKLPAGSRPIRLVHISDLHCDAQERLEGRLVEAIAELKPDLIAFTGDAANNPAGLELFRETIAKLAKIAPVYGVEGNWDRGSSPLDGTDVTQLRGQALPVRVGETDIRLVGASYGNQESIDLAMRRVPHDEFTIMLYHTPDEIERAVRLGVDLNLAGHTHGGQIALPFYGALVTLSKHGKRFEAGLYREGKTWLYINRGIGMEGLHAPPVRFFARPEVTLIEIAPQDTDQSQTGQAASR